jgi:hypothetical protein
MYRKEQSMTGRHCTPTPTAGLPFVAALSLLAGCAGITTYSEDGRIETRSQQDFETYAESVFRRQNEAGSELAMIYMDLDGDADANSIETLSSAEDRMLDACRPLNDAALLQVKGEEPGFFKKLHVMNSLSRCERYTGELEYLLQRLDYAHPQENAAAEASGNF